jgi:Transcription factor Iwr1
VKSTGPEPLQILEKPPSISGQVKPGVPLVQATAPGDEIKDTLKLKAAHRDRLEGLRRDKTPQGIFAEVLDETESTNQTKLRNGTALRRDFNGARRFHLTRDNRFLLSPEYGGIRKSKSTRKSHVAIFIEQSLATSTQRVSASTKSPIDRIVDFVGKGAMENKQQQNQKNGLVQPVSDLGTISRERSIPPFVQTPAQEMRTGYSIRDPPSTWDHTSDQLADELAALALEFESADLESSNVMSTNDFELDSKDMSDDDFIYDTYLRLPLDPGAQPYENQDAHGGKIGVLVIDEDNRDLWETYVESDNETEWDEEDADSNGLSMSSMLNRAR